MGLRREVARRITERIALRSAAVRDRYLARVRAHPPVPSDRNLRVAIIACAVAPGTHDEAVDHETAWLARSIREAGGEADLLVRLPSASRGMAGSRDGARAHRNMAALNTSLALSQRAFDMAIALRMVDDAAAGVITVCLRYGHCPLLCLPEMLERPAPLSRCAFEMQVLLGALGLYDGGSLLGGSGEPRLLRATLQHALARPFTSRAQGPIGEVIDEEAVVQAALALLAIGAANARFVSLAAVAHAAGILLDRDDVSELARVMPAEAARSFGASLPLESRGLAVVRALRARGLFDTLREARGTEQPRGL